MDHRTALGLAIARIEDMLKGDDGQAWKEAEKAIPTLRAALAAPQAPAATAGSVLADLDTAAARKWQGDPDAQRAGLFARAAAEIRRLQAPAAPVWRRLTASDLWQDSDIMAINGTALGLEMGRLVAFARAIESALARINGATLADKA